MMNDITLNNSTQYKIDDILMDITFDLLASLNLDNVSLSVNIVTNEEIIEINNNYRNKNSVTDVITFSYEDSDNFNELFAQRELGDIFIAIDYVYENSKKIGNTMAREMSFVLAHGILHTLGYDHDSTESESVMFNLQETLINNVVEKGSVFNEIFS